MADKKRRAVLGDNRDGGGVEGRENQLDHAFDAGTLIMNAVKDTAMSALAVPDDLRKYLNKAMRGELEMRFRGLNESANLLYALGHQMILSLFALAAGGLLWVGVERTNQSLTITASAVLGFFVLLLTVSLFSARKYKRR